MILKIIILLNFIALAYSDCSLWTGNENIPSFVKSFGSRKVLLPKYMNTEIKWRDGETLEAFCDNGFRYGCDRRITQSNFRIKCESNNLYYSTFNGWQYIIMDCDRSLRCADSSGFHLYESKKLLKNCAPHMSLGIGIQVANYEPFTFAGVCYDWNSMDLKYINYLAYRSKSGFFTNNPSEEALQIHSVTLDDKLDRIQDYFNFISQNNTILEQFNFENSSLIQDLPLKDELKSFENILQIMWWRNLRLANWRLFLNLLEERSRDVPYNIFTGTSGVIYMPSLDNDCDVNKTLSYINGNNQRKAVPAFVWSFLNSTHSETLESFVVIGYNSPFYYNEPSIYLCNDICDQIEWLHSFEKLRKISTLGLMYCCHPKDVAHKLDNFPFSLLEESDMTTTTAETPAESGEIEPYVIPEYPGYL